MPKGATIELIPALSPAPLPENGKHFHIWTIGCQMNEADSARVAAMLHEAGYRGDMSLYKVRLADRSLMKVAVANTGPGQRGFSVGEVVWLSWPADAGVVLAR